MWGGRRRETQGDPSASAPKIFSSGEGAVDLTVLEELSLPCQLSLPPVQVSSYRLLFGSRVRKSEPLCLFPLSDSMFGTNFLPVTCVWSLHWSVHKKESNRMSPTASACLFHSGSAVGGSADCAQQRRQLDQTELFARQVQMPADISRFMLLTKGTT